MTAPIHPSHLPMKAAADLDRCVDHLREASASLQEANTAMLFAYGFGFATIDDDAFGSLTTLISELRAAIFEAEGVLQ